MNSALLSSKNMCWCTPQGFFDELYERMVRAMDRLTERDEFGNANIIVSDIVPKLQAELSNALTATLNRLAAYEDTGLTPEEVAAMKAEYSDTFQAHLNQLLDIKDKCIAQLETENARLNKLLDNTECVMREENNGQQ